MSYAQRFLSRRARIPYAAFTAATRKKPAGKASSSYCGTRDKRLGKTRRRCFQARIRDNGLANRETDSDLSHFLSGSRLVAKCARCGKVFWWGVKVANKKYCTAKCARLAIRAAATEYISPDLIELTVQQIHKGKCPLCAREGPVDVHVSHNVISFIVLSRWASKSYLCCRRCGKRAQTNDLLLTLATGWWGIPWGLVLTPVQVARNLLGLLDGPKPGAPSKVLRDLVIERLGAQIVAATEPVCPKCEYSLRGNVTGVCPECGNRFAPKPNVDLFAPPREARHQDGDS
jgi:hypothetical protein